MVRRELTKAAVALTVLAAVLVYALTDNPVLDNICYLGVLIGAGAGAWIGAQRAPVGRRLVPRLIAVGVILGALGDVVWNTLDALGDVPDVSIADVPWLASYAALIAALWIVLMRSHSSDGGRPDLDFFIDLATIGVVSVLILWRVSLDDIFAEHGSTVFERTVLGSYPVADAVLLTLVVRVLISRNARAAIDVGFAAGVCLWLFADIVYLHAAVGGHLELLADIAWMVAPVLVAGTAWRACEPDVDHPGDATVGGSAPQVLVAVIPLMVPAALELISDLQGGANRTFELFTGTAVLLGLAFARTTRMIRYERHISTQLELARDAALEASRAKSMFLANVSHEIRTPLTTMLASTELLEDTPLDEVQLSFLERTRRSGKALKRLVEGILDFSRIEAGQLNLSSEEFDLNEMVADLADIYVPHAMEAGLGFEWDVDPGAPQVVTGDSGRVFQVLTNLLDNALKFTQQGHISLSVRTADPGDGGVAGVEFVVADTGIGIREEDQESVFDSFRQVDGSATRTYGGSGLGLAICKELTELMGGTITLQSRFGAGTTCSVHLPLRRAAAGPRPPERAAPVAS